MADQDTTPVVVDTNILFSALASGSGPIAQLLSMSPRRFVICETALVELFTKKEKIVRASRASEQQVADALHALLILVTLEKEAVVGADHLAAAQELCAGVDADDTPHVALTLALDGLLWTGDRRLKDGLRRKGFDRFFDPATEGRS